MKEKVKACELLGFVKSPIDARECLGFLDPKLRKETKARKIKKSVSRSPEKKMGNEMEKGGKTL
jgi:hypothetical protein